MKVNVVLFSLCIGFIATSAFSATNSTLSDGLLDCLKVKSDGKRLSCFDQLAQNNLVQLNSQSSGNASIVKKEQIKLEEKQKIDDFSKEDLIKKEEDKGLESITATISSLKQLIRGQWVIDLDNSQQWQQTDSAKIKLNEGDVIILRKGALGVVYLSKKSNARSIRVKRLK